MNDAALNLRLRKCRINRFAEARQAVHAEHVNVLYTAVFEVIHYRKPEFCTFIFAYPNSQNIFSPVILGMMTACESAVKSGKELKLVTAPCLDESENLKKINCVTNYYQQSSFPT